MLVSADLLTVTHASFKYELSVSWALFWTSNILVRWLVTWFEGIQKGLDDVVAIHMSRQLQDIFVELLNHLITLSLHAFNISSKGLYQGLHSSGTMNTKWYWSSFIHNWVNNNWEFDWLTDFNNLLTKIVAKLIRHRICKCVLKSINQSWHKLCGQVAIWVVLEFLLYHAAPCLIISQSLCLINNFKFTLTEQRKIDNSSLRFVWNRVDILISDLGLLHLVEWLFRNQKVIITEAWHNLILRALTRKWVEYWLSFSCWVQVVNRMIA